MKRYDFNNVLPSKTAPPVVEEILMSTFNSMIEFSHKLLDITKMNLLNIVWTIPNIIAALCSIKSFQCSIVLRS